MIDINELVNETYDIKMKDGTILHLKKPTRALLKELMKIDEQNDEAVLLDEVYAMFTKMINTNTDGIKYKQKDLEELDIGTVMYVIKDYVQETVTQLKN
jgi:hypothetical protein